VNLRKSIWWAVSVLLVVGGVVFVAVWKERERAEEQKTEEARQAIEESHFRRRRDEAKKEREEAAQEAAQRSAHVRQLIGSLTSLRGAQEGRFLKGASLPCSLVKESLGKPNFTVKNSDKALSSPTKYWNYEISPGKAARVECYGDGDGKILEICFEHECISYYLDSTNDENP
jgi:hypothetical protein